jgi:hypothetical protein
MLTIENLDAMDNEQRWTTFEALASKRYGATGINRKMAEEFGNSTQTYFTWKRKPASIPNVYFFCLERMNEAADEKDARILAKFEEVTADLRGLAIKLGDLAGIVAG